MDGAARIIRERDGVFLLSDSYTQNIRVERLQGRFGIRRGWVAGLVASCQAGVLLVRLDSGSGRGGGCGPSWGPGDPAVRLELIHTPLT